MHHPVSFPCLILSALLGAASLLPAQAGGAINKCIDGAGRVTLTDQACDAHTVSSTVAVPGTPAPGALPAPRATMMATMPVREVRAMQATPPHAALTGDMATLRQARIRMMLQDAAPHAQLASLDH